MFLATASRASVAAILCLSALPAAAGETVVLFDGTSLDGWVSSATGLPAAWTLRDGYMEVAPGAGDIQSRHLLGDFKLKLEFWLPFEPHHSGQARANSGIYLQGRYELQVLDTYDNETFPKGMCGAIYDQIAPSTNASLPPEEWQSYEVTFRAPRLDGRGALMALGRITVVLNGTTVIDAAALDRPTAGGSPLSNEPGPLRLQDHGSLVRYRNVTVQPLVD